MAHRRRPPTGLAWTILLRGRSLTLRAGNPSPPSQRHRSVFDPACDPPASRGSEAGRVTPSGVAAMRACRPPGVEVPMGLIGVLVVIILLIILLRLVA